jgi:hypothetical protein
MAHAAWVEGMRNRSVLDVASALGLKIDKRRHALSPCPACGEERRHTKSGDPRGAVGFRTDGRGWKCFQCEATGDALELVARRIGGGRLRDLGETRKTEVREWCARFLGLDPSERAGSQARKLAPLQPRAVPPPPPPLYPPADELAAVWASCVPVTDDPEVSGYLNGRGILAAEVARRDLARALPASAKCPAWAGTGDDDRWRSWAAQGARLVVPLFDARGELRSVLARFPRKVEVGPKSLGAKGYQRGGLVMANAQARAWLNGIDATPSRCSVLEGETCYLLSAAGPAPRQTWASRGGSPAFFGVFSGSWTRELADRIPDGSHVAIATDDDDQGDAYAREIGGTLAARVGAGRLNATRERPTKAEEDGTVTATTKTKGLDVCDVGGLDNTTSEPLLSAEDIAKGALENARERALADATIDGELRPELLPSTMAPEALERAGFAPPPEPDPFADRWKPLDPTWLGEKPPDRTWLLRRPADDKGDTSAGFLPLGKVGMVVAKGGAGKTMALVQLALAVATGRDWLDYSTPTTGRVLLALGEEDETELRRRVHYAFDAMWPEPTGSPDNVKRLTREREAAREAIRRRVVALPLAGLPVAFVRTDPRLREVSQTEALEYLRKRLADDSGEPWRLIVLDPLSRFAGVETETDNAAATRFVQAIESLTEAPGNPTVLVAHHTTKTSRKGEDPALDATAARGASALTDGVRWVLSMLPEKPDVPGIPSPFVHLELVKSNYSPPAPRVTVVREDHGTLRTMNAAERAKRDEKREGIAERAKRDATKSAKSTGTGVP